MIVSLSLSVKFYKVCLICVQMFQSCSYLCNILHIDGLLGLSHMSYNTDVQREDDLRVWRHHTVIELRIFINIEETCSQLGDAVPLSIHEQATPVGVDQSADSLQNLKNHLLHIDVLLHVCNEIVEYRSLLYRAYLLKSVHIHFRLWYSQDRGHGTRFELFVKIAPGKIWVSIQELLHVFLLDTHLGIFWPSPSTGR